MSTTARGVPYPQPSDPNNVPADLQALAQWVNDKPGIATLTTTQRNALTGAALWDGRLIWNATTVRYERYVAAGGGSWVSVVEGLGILPPITQVFDVSGTWAKPSGATRVRLRIVGGGDGGTGAGGSGAGQYLGGNGGGYLEVILPASDLDATATVTVGAGGAGGSGAGGVGGSSSVQLPTPYYFALAYGGGAASQGGLYGGEAALGVAYLYDRKASDFRNVGTIPGVLSVATGGGGSQPNGHAAGAGGSWNADSGTATFGGWSSSGLRAGGGTAGTGLGSAGVPGSIAHGICGSGGAAARTGSGAVGGKYGGGGGAGYLNGGAGGQGGVAITTYFD